MTHTTATGRYAKTTHYRVANNVILCGADATYASTEKSEVTCGNCLITQIGAGERMESADGLRWAISANRKRSLPGRRFDSVKVWILKERVNGKVIVRENNRSEERAREWCGL